MNFGLYSLLLFPESYLSYIYRSPLFRCCWARGATGRPYRTCVRVYSSVTLSESQCHWLQAVLCGLYEVCSCSSALPYLMRHMYSLSSSACSCCACGQLPAVVRVRAPFTARRVSVVNESVSSVEHRLLCRQSSVTRVPGDHLPHFRIAVSSVITECLCCCLPCTSYLYIGLSGSEPRQNW
jgi:hypothetical protein